MASRLLIVGWDGADWDIVEDLVERGCLPNVEALLRHGVRGDLQSTIPSHSWAAWSSFLTGVNPGRHGVFDFVQRHPNEPDRRIPVTSASIGSPTFLRLLSEAGCEVRAGNIPVTHPPTPVLGRMISGVAIPPGARFVYPAAWEPELSGRAPFPLNGMEWTRFAEHPAGLVAEAASFVDRRTASFEAMLEGDWRVAVCVYVAPDRLQHALGAYLLPAHPDHARLAETELGTSLREVYRKMDDALGRLRTASGPDATTLLMSDHGFRPLKRSANLNRVLQSAGLAARSKTAGIRRSSAVKALARTRLGSSFKRRVRAPSKLDWSRTVAYQSSAGPGVSMNLRGREPNGIVEPNDYERVREEVRAALLAFTDPETGVHPVADALPAADLYHGPFTSVAPDLLIRAAPLWAFAHTDALVEDTEWPSGAHRREGIVAAAGPGVPSGSLGERGIEDMAATVLAFADVAGPQLDGRAIEEISGRSARSEGVPVVEQTGSTRTGVERTDADDEYVVQHLRDLGYIE